MSKTPKAYRLSDKAKAHIEAIREHYKLPTATAAVELALKEITLQPDQPRKSLDGNKWADFVYLAEFEAKQQGFEGALIVDFIAGAIAVILKDQAFPEKKK